ncbi:MAG: hypothetical protein AAGI53_12380 [Planctomycetota bacterium]
MLKLTDGQCGLCAHFGENSGPQDKIVQIRINGEGPEDLVTECGHPDNASRSLKVTPISGCQSFKSAQSA